VAKDQLNITNPTPLLHKINTAGTKMFVYRNALDMNPIATFEKSGPYWSRKGITYKSVALALASLE
jgi:hypothetical protein